MTWRQTKAAPFFVGYLTKVPKPLQAFLGVFTICFVAGLGLAAFARLKKPQLTDLVLRHQRRAALLHTCA